MMVYSVLALNNGVIVGSIPAAVYRCNGGAWQELEGVRLNSSGASFPPSPELQSRTRYLTADPTAPNRLYAAIEVGGLLLSDDAGQSWRPANDGLTDPDVHEVLACKHHHGKLFSACGEAAFRSLDRAQHWEEITPSTHDYGMSLAEDGQRTVYLGSAKGRPNTWIRERGADAAIFRTRDLGAHWETVIDGLHGGVMHMCSAPNGTGIIAGTSDGTLLAVDDSRARVLVTGLPCITAVELGA